MYILGRLNLITYIILGVKFARYSDFCRIFWHSSKPLLLCNLWTRQFYVGLHERITFVSNRLFNGILPSNKYGADNILSLFWLYDSPSSNCKLLKIAVVPQKPPSWCSG